MPLIEVLPNSSSISAPGWAYVPDTGYDPSKAAIQPSGARKRNARISGITGGDTTARQNNALLKRLADLDKDNHKDVQITLPPKQKGAGGRVSKGKTPAIRKILVAQKTFANYIADEEAGLAAQDPQGPILARAPVSKIDRTSSAQIKRSLSTTLPYHSTTSTTPNSSTPSAILAPQNHIGLNADDAHLLQSCVPSAPSEALIEALVSAPPLSYNAARTKPSVTGRPQRHFCEICGYWGRIKCLKCGARTCALECKKTHDEERCQKYF
ncbi:hypothetical protein MMC06_001153 [Schaereria dolodes]|nr:hypothetical protein [Schaereria dolodes]